MINFLISDFYHAVMALRYQIEECQKGDPEAIVSELDDAIAHVALNYAVQASNKLSLVPPLTWILRTRARLKDHKLTNAQFVNELEAILQLIEDEAGREYFFHYEKTKAEMLMRATSDWKVFWIRFNPQNMTSCKAWIAMPAGTTLHPFSTLCAFVKEGYALSLLSARCGQARSQLSEPTGPNCFRS
jgi:hypothetical protein